MQKKVKTPMDRAIAAMKKVHSGEMTYEQAATTYGFKDKVEAGLAILAAQKYVEAFEEKESGNV